MLRLEAEGHGASFLEVERKLSLRPLEVKTKVAVMKIPGPGLGRGSHGLDVTEAPRAQTRELRTQHAGGTSSK